MNISLDGKGPYTDNVPEKRLWRTVKYEVIYLKAVANAMGTGGKWEPISGSPMIRGPIKPWATGPQPRCSTEVGFLRRRNRLQEKLHRTGRWCDRQDQRDSRLIPPRSCPNNQADFRQMVLGQAQVLSDGNVA